MSRIVAGSRGGRRLVMPADTSTRPTTDRVREALFSALASWAGGSTGTSDLALAGLSFLDLYAGSGAVGLEAASRGAAPVMLVEASRRTASVAARNIASVGLDVELRTGRVEQLLAEHVSHPFDVVFADPPYELESAAVSAVLVALVDHGWLSDPGMVVVERSSRSADLDWPGGLETWQRRYGETVLHFGSR